LSFELSQRCLDETLPEFYIEQPSLMLDAMRQHLLGADGH
jgi:hypothetical protein